MITLSSTCRNGHFATSLSLFCVALLTAWLLLGVFHIPGVCEAASKPDDEASDIPILSKEQAEKLNKESAQGEDIPVLGEKTEQKIDQAQQKGSQLITGAAQWLDSFFNDPRYVREENKSRAKISMKLGYSKFDDFEYRPAIRLRLNFPGLEKKAKLYLSANGSEDFDIDSNPILDTSKTRDEELTGGVRYYAKKSKRYNISTNFGFSTSYVYAGIRYRYLHPFFSSRWKGRLTNRLRYYSDDGWENRAAYDVERYLGDRYFFRTTFSGVLSEEVDGVPFSGIARLYQVLSIDRALLYDFGTYFETRPEFEVSDIQFKLRYRQRLYRDWLVLEVAPQVTFPEEQDYEIDPGIVIKLEMDFGYKQNEKAYESIFKF